MTDADPQRRSESSDSSGNQPTEVTSFAEADDAHPEQTTDGSEPTGDALLELEGLKTHYPIHRGWLRREVGRVRAVDGIDLTIQPGETVGLVGESGSGKSTVAKTILQLEEPTAGTISFEGKDIADLSKNELQEYRRRVQLIVQDPNEAFSPRMKIGRAVAEPLRLNGMRDEARREAIARDLLERVGLSADDYERYPHEFSGGEKQRIAIARALIVNPDLIIADEPTSALDSRVQADVLGLLDRIRREYDIAVLFISHDIDVVRMFCDRIAVMYLGELVEKGPIQDVLEFPAHPYTRVLLGSVPSLDPTDRLLARPLTETVPDPASPPSGCRFHTRCPEVIEPEDVDLSRECWQSVAEFRFTMQAEELPDELLQVDDVNEAVRNYFDLPDPIPDERVERALSGAISALRDGELADAVETLSEATPSVCESNEPSMVDHDGRPVACLRYDDSIDADPLPWNRE